MPPIAKRFHRSMYITLGLACASLGYAELDFLPAISVFAVIVLILLGIAYRVEGRWSLSIRAANFIGGAIAAVAVVWVTDQFLRPDALIDQLPWPSRILPFLGPLLMILVPAKLFRPKHNGDFWALQGIGLIAVALGCALTTELIFGAMLLAYLISAVYALTLFYYFRQAELDYGRRPAASPRALTQAVWWAGGVTALALVLFLLTPRVTEARWELSGYGTHMQTGVDETRPVIDLNRSGTLSVNRDKVFEVYAFTKDCLDPPPKVDVDPGQRWQQMTFNSYDHGKWDHRDLGAAGRARFGSRRDFVYDPRQPVKLADLGPGQYYFEFRLAHTGSSPRHIHAEPIASRILPNGDRRNIESPRAVGDSRIPWIAHADETAVPSFVARMLYDQVVLPTKEPGVSPPERIDPDYAEQLRNVRSLPRLQAWSRELLQNMVADGRLPKGALGKRESVPYLPAWAQSVLLSLAVKQGWVPETALAERVPPKYYEAVCRAFEAHLARSGQFTYTMNLTRQNTAIDPVEDFVLNTRKGHCTRFATALALMLRTVGVPTQIILGYRGYETNGNGLYEVLQCHAHSWVEAAIYRPPTGPDDPGWRWLTLDPTPAAEDAADSEFSWGNWWEYTRQGVAGLFKNFIVEYDAEQQERTRYAVSQSNWWAVPRSVQRFVFGPNGDNWLQAALFAVGAVAIAVAARKVVRRPRPGVNGQSHPTMASYGRLLQALKRALGLAPHTGETAREFAAIAGGRLAAEPATCSVAGVPAEMAAAYYRSRFGDRPLTDDERLAIDTDLDRLEAALAAPRRG
jgi:hypothetical protein